jgi:predicted RNA binding protein YcfA (HicA-like mRNA interferase family)
VRLKHKDGRVVTIPDYAGEVISRGLLKKILRDANMTEEEFPKLLED